MSNTGRRNKELVQRIVELRKAIQEWQATLQQESCDCEGEWNEDLKIAEYAARVCDEALQKTLVELHERGCLLCTHCAGTGVQTVECGVCGGKGYVEKAAK